MSVISGFSNSPDQPYERGGDPSLAETREGSKSHQRVGLGLFDNLETKGDGMTNADNYKESSSKAAVEANGGDIAIAIGLQNTNAVESSGKDGRLGRGEEADNTQEELPSDLSDVSVRLVTSMILPLSIFHFHR